MERKNTVAVTSSVPAPPERVYGILRDYRGEHPRILPPAYFRKLEVLEGGEGAGTKTRLEMRVMGSRRVFYHDITEPEPGRVLVETEVGGASVTTFTVAPADGGRATLLTIETAFSPRPGILGGIERWLTSALLRKIYKEEIARLSAYAGTGRAPGDPAS